MTDAAAATTDEPALDEAALARLSALDPGGRLALVERVFAAFARSLDGWPQTLEHTLRAGDLGAVRLATHTLKSSAASVGAARLAGLCARAEQAASAGDAGALGQLAAPLRHEVERVATAVTRRLEVARPSLCSDP